MKKQLLLAALLISSMANAESTHSVDFYQDNVGALYQALHQCQTEQNHSHNCKNAEIADKYVEEQKAMAEEGLNMTAVAKLVVMEYYSFETNQQFPKDNIEAGISTPEKINSEYVTSVKIDHDKIIVTLKNGQTIAQMPQVLDGILYWECVAEGTTFELQYLPKACRESIQSKQ